MKRYAHLTLEQRYHICGLKSASMSITLIAQNLGVHKSTISRELRRNKVKRGYRPKQAQEKADDRSKGKKNAQRFTPEDWLKVSACLNEDLSPEQVSGRLARNGQLSISHETIYQYIYKDKRNNGTLYLHLRCQKKRRKRYGSGKDRRGCIKNRVGIEQRPAIVDDRSRFGDWEGDTIIGQNHQGVVVTLVERKSRYLLAAGLESKEAAGVAQLIGNMLKPLQTCCHTITFDNGKEFACHETIAKALRCDVFFARPYHSWERGTNENINGLLRKYLPRSMNLKHCTDQDIQNVVDRLNHRPRKCLNFQTPYEAFFNKPSRWTNPLANVALGT